MRSPGSIANAAFGENRAAVRQHEVQMLGANRPLAVALHVEAVVARLPGRRLLERAVERQQAIDARLPVGERLERVHEPRQRALHGAEGARDLRQAAERDRAGEEPVAGDEEREHDRHLVVADRERVDPLRDPHQVPPVLPDALDPAAEVPVLGRLAPVERDAFGVLAEADERVAEIGLALLLLEVEADERAADPVGERATDDRVHERDPHEIAGDRHLVLAQPQRERPRQVPQDHGERRERHDLAHHPETEGQRAGGEEPHVLLDPLIGVVGAVMLELETVVHLLARASRRGTAG